MYFQKFPKTYYTLDDRRSVQVVTNILLRVVFTEELKNNFTVLDQYDVQDGDTPEIISYKLYGDPNLHWVILHLNDIIDPRFDWLLSYNNLLRFVEGKYANINAIHHFNDSTGKEIAGNVLITIDTTSANINVGSALINQTSSGKGFVTSKPSSNSFVVTATEGSYHTGDLISEASNLQIQANVTSATVISGLPVTNLSYEDNLNEQKRRIVILKPEFIETVVKQFEAKISDING